MIQAWNSEGKGGKVQGLTGPALAAALSRWSPWRQRQTSMGPLSWERPSAAEYQLDRLIPPPGPGSGRLHLGARVIGQEWPAMPWGGYRKERLGRLCLLLSSFDNVLPSRTIGN